MNVLFVDFADGNSGDSRGEACANNSDGCVCLLRRDANDKYEPEATNEPERDAKLLKACMLLRPCFRV